MAIFTNSSAPVEKVMRLRNNIEKVHCTYSQGNIITDVLDRQNRRRKLVMLNKNEPYQNMSMGRNHEDLTNIKNIFKGFNINLENIKFFMLERFVASKNRPLTIILNLDKDAMEVLHNKAKPNV